MRAGSSQIKITPEAGIELSGYVVRAQPSVGVLDDLFARALFLEEAGERLLWLHVDLLGLPPETVGRVRQAVAADLGLAERQIVLSATHTHAGPATMRLRCCGQVDPAYVAQLEGSLCEAARQAAARRETAGLSVAEGRAEVGVDRRRPTGNSHTDHRLPVLAFQHPDGRFLAVLANYPIHHVALHSDNRHVSADMAGVAAAGAAARLPGNPVVLFTNGACGNINPPRQAAGFEMAALYGEQLGDAVVRAVQSSRPAAPPRLGSALAEIRLPLTVPTPAEVEQRYRESVDALRPAPSTAGERRIRQAMTEWRDETLRLLASGSAPATVPLEVQAVRIGPVFFAAMGAEVFSRMADELRGAHTPQTYVVGYANGDIGYLPFREIYPEGGYEVDSAYRYYGNFMVAPGAYEQARDEAVTLLRSLAGPPE